jgi:outer membrane protein TolC
MLGLGFTWDIFKGLEEWGHLSEAKSNEGRARADLRECANRITLEIEEATIAIGTGRETLQVTRERVGLAEERLRIIRKRYQEGLTTVVELEQAALALSRSRLAWLQAIHDLRTDLARLRLVTGELISSLPVLSCVPVTADPAGRPDGT